jgi:TonB family protein
MTAATLRLDLESTRVRTRWMMTVSLAFHALLFVWLIFHHVTEPTLSPITEITMIEPGDLAPITSPAAPAADGAAAAGASNKTISEMHFKRSATKAEMEPDPQSSWSFEDRLEARLAAMQQNPTPGTAIAPTKTPVSVFGTSPALMASGTGIGSPIALNRGGSGAGAPLPLARGGGTGSSPTLATVAESHHGGGDAPAPARSSESTARRTVAGASITGPLADRPVLSYAVPAYPEWAKHDAVEGAVTLYFVVRADGGVKENILVQKTAGFEDFDENARAALRAWRFKPLAAGQSGEQWGTITFRYRLRDAG